MDLSATVAIVACCLVWGFSQVAVKAVAHEVPTLTQAFIRSAGATLMLLAWMRWRQIPWFAADGTLLPALAAGALFSLEFALLYTGLQWTTASRMTVFLYTAPLMVALGLSPLLGGRERLGPLQWAGLLLAFAGVVIAFLDGFVGTGAQTRQHPLQHLGDLLGLGAAAGWAATTVLVRRSALATAPPERVLLAQLGISAVVLAFVATGAGHPLLPPLAMWSIPIVAGSLVFQTLAVSFVSYLAWFQLIQRYSSTAISSYSLLTPIAGVVFGIALLREPLSARLVLAASMVLAGLVLVGRRRKAASTHCAFSNSYRSETTLSAATDSAQR